MGIRRVTRITYQDVGIGSVSRQSDGHGFGDVHYRITETTDINIVDGVGPNGRTYQEVPGLFHYDAKIIPIRDSLPVGEALVLQLRDGRRFPFKYGESHGVRWLLEQGPLDPPSGP